jgi:hypothetical protein
LYGSCDAGRTIKNGEEAPEIRGYMESIGKQLNLKKHQVKTAMGEIKEIFGPADIEVHRGVCTFLSRSLLFFSLSPLLLAHFPSFFFFLLWC